MIKSCECGCKQFYANQDCTLSVVVDTDGDTIEELGTDVKRSASGPYECVNCEKEYQSLEDLPEFPSGTFPEEKACENNSADEKRLYVVCVGGDNTRDTQVYLGPEENDDKTFDDESWSDWKDVEVYLGIVPAVNAEEAIHITAEREQNPEHIFRAYEVKSQILY